MDLFIFLLFVGILIFGVYFLFAIFSAGSVTPPPVEPRTNSYPPEQMDEGDYHSGPYGYSPNTAYPETQYGSMFNEEADWNEEER
jgi:hypothetical protein